MYKHIISKWRANGGDLFSFYLNTSHDVKRYILEALGIEVEPDKYPDHTSRVIEMAMGKKRRPDVLPFETEVLHQYFLFGFNNSLDSMKKVSPPAWQTITDNNIDFYGDCENWSAFWSVASQKDKELLLKHIAKLA